MNIILFPTRFYPAISGGDFYMQRIGEAFKRIFKDNIQILTSNALDFGALHGQGRIVPQNHKNYHNYRNLEIQRFPVKSDSVDVNQAFQGQTQKKMNLSQEAIQFFMANGPVLPEFIRMLGLNMNVKLHGLFQDKIETDPRNSIIHTTYLPYLNLVYSVLLAKKLKIPSITTPFLHSENIRYQGEAIYQLLKNFDAIFACTREERRICIQNGIDQNKVYVLPMGVDIKKFEKDYRHYIPLKTLKEHRILFCGNKNYEKGAITLLKTIPLFKDPQLSISFIFIGPSTTAFNMELAKIKPLMPTHLNIINYTPDNLNGMFDPKKIAAFQLADIYCMPSRSEAYGITYLEAWATKKPVIAADFPQMREVITHQKDGILVPFNNVEELKTVIDRLLHDPRLREEMGMNGFKRIQVENTWETIAQKTHEIYQHLIDTHEG